MTRYWTALAAAALIAGLTAGCSSSSKPALTGADPADVRLSDASALIVQCALTQGHMKPPTGLTTPSGQTPWLKGTKLVLTGLNVGTFNEWYNGVVRTTVAGKYLEDWVQQAADSGKLPAAVCGTSVTTPALLKQVFAGDPSVRDPW